MNVFDYRERARRRLPRIVFDFLEGGADDEKALVHNRAVFDRLRFASRRMTDVSSRDISVELLGCKQSAPVVIAPTGMNGLFWPGGDIALARAAEQARIPFTLSTASNSSIEEVACHNNGDKWFQLYAMGRKQTEKLVDRALTAGYKKLVLTADVQVNANRERDQRNGFGIPTKYTPRLILDGMLHPAWSTSFLRYGVPELANFVSTGLRIQKVRLRR